jgi:hypothetical protein
VQFSHRGTFHNNKEVEMAVRERLRRQDPDLYREGIFQLVPKWDKFINVSRD